MTPIVQEVYGRLGRRAGALFKQVASHSAQATGGTQGQIAFRQGYVFSYICSEMATSLAMESAERIATYVRYALHHGAAYRPVASLVDLSNGTA